MRINDLRYKAVAEVTFDDFVCTPDGGLDYHPYLTTHLNGPDWERIYEGIAFANRLGAVLNVHVTIAWERAGICGDDRVSDALVRWAGGFRKWCAARHRPCYYVYVHERSRDHGLHTHLLTSVPQQDKQDLRGLVVQLSAPRCGFGSTAVERDMRAASRRPRCSASVVVVWLSDEGSFPVVALITRSLQ